jgi:hypothetical protein
MATREIMLIAVHTDTQYIQIINLANISNIFIFHLEDIIEYTSCLDKARDLSRYF